MLRCIFRTFMYGAFNFCKIKIFIFRWREGFWSAVTNIFDWKIAETSSVRQYHFEIVNDLSVKLFTGEYGRLGSFEKQRP